MTSVNAELSYLRALQNFENIKLTVGVTDDVREGEGVEKAFERVYAFVEKKLIEKIDVIEAELKDTSSVLSK